MTHVNWNRTGRTAITALIALVACTVRADEARVRMDTALKAAEDGLYEFAEQEAHILAGKADFPYSDEALTLVMRCRVETGKYSKAIQLFPRLEREHANSLHLTEARYWYGRALLGTALPEGKEGPAGTLQNAADVLKIVARRSKNATLTARANLYFGICLNMQGNPKEAVETLSGALHNIPSQERGLLALELSKAYQELHSYEQALVSLRGAIEKDAPIDVRRTGYYQSGEVNYILGRWKQAIENYGKAAELNQSGKEDDLDYRSHYGTGWTLSKSYEEDPDNKKDLLAQAIKEMQKASKSPNGEISRPALIKLGHLLTTADRVEEAKAVLYPLYEDAASRPQAAYLLSQIEEHKGRISTAVNLVTGALPSASGETGVTLMLRLAELHEKAGDYNAAIDVLNELTKRLARGPLAAQVTFDKARLLIMAGKPGGAINVLEQLDKGPETEQFVPPEDILFWRGKVTLSIAVDNGKMETYAMAEKHLRQYLERYPKGNHRDECLDVLIDLYATVPNDEIRRSGSIFLAEVAQKAGFSNARQKAIHKARAELESTLGDHSAAARAYKAAAAASEGEEGALLILAAQEYLSGGFISEAAGLMPAIEKSRRREEDMAAYHALAAQIESSSGRHGAAAAAFEKLAELKPADAGRVEALLAAAGEYINAGDTPRAEKALAGIEPANTEERADYYVLLARINYSKGNAAAAAAAAETAMKAAAGDSNAARTAGIYLGRSLRSLGKLQEAANALISAAEGATGVPRIEALTEAGEALFMAGDIPQGRRFYLTAYFETLSVKGMEELNHKALRGAVETSLALAADTTDAAERARLLESTNRILSRYPDSEWKTREFERIRSLR
ncbi:MAG: tetratricopeptide repeat protein [Planctomycetes bacterium]|nr:tetratricopeptide repeat protein [Planctomycetota bacterium]